MNKLRAVYAVFTKGQAVADPVLWKKSQITGGMITGLLAAMVGLVRAFGYALPLTDDQLVQIGGAVIAVWGVLNSGATLASTKLIGLPPLPGPTGTLDKSIQPAMPEVSPQFHDTLPPVRHAANGDPIDPSARRE